MRKLVAFAAALALSACGDKDNSAVTDQAARDLANAQAKVGAKQRDLETTAADVERRKRELAAEEQTLADQERALASTQNQLGSAHESLARARASYQTAVAARFAKLDASIAERAAKSDAASKDAVVGLRARRDQLATKLATITTTTDDAWSAYAKDVDTTFDAIERDLVP
jgi:uncharacterized protein (DUF3084 family)